MTEPGVTAHGELELDFDDPMVREELRVIVQAVARLLAYSRRRASTSIAYDVGRSILEKSKNRRKTH